LSTGDDDPISPSNVSGAAVPLVCDALAQRTRSRNTADLLVDGGDRLDVHFGSKGPVD